LDRTQQSYPESSQQSDRQHCGELIVVSQKKPDEQAGQDTKQKSRDAFCQPDIDAQEPVRKPIGLEPFCIKNGLIVQAHLPSQPPEPASHLRDLAPLALPLHHPLDIVRPDLPF
jgi:hypothetical protein